MADEMKPPAEKTDETRDSVQRPADPKPVSARPPKQLFRSCRDRMLGGVCGGLAEYFEVDVSLVRLTAVILAFSGMGILAYIVAWIVIPEDPACGKPEEPDLGKRAEAVAQELSQRVNSDDRGRSVAGLFLMGLGIFFLMQSLFGFQFWARLWPVILIVLGLSIILGRR